MNGIKGRKKVLWLDTETSGLSYSNNGIIEASFLVEIDGLVVEERTFEMNPVGMKIDKEALEVNSFKLDDIQKMHPDTEVKRDIQGFFEKYVDKYDREDKFYPGGFNVDFDIRFMEALWKRSNDNYFYSYVNSGKRIDPFKILPFLEYMGLIVIDSCSLSRACEIFGVVLDNAHSSLADIRATRLLSNKIVEKLLNR